MKYFLLFFLFSLCESRIQAQNNKTVNIWYLSDSSIIDWSNSSYPHSKKAAPIYTEEGTGSICDSFGNLLFYCNGQNLYSSNHIKLNKSFSLMGDQSTTQGALILKHPESNLFHLFTNRGYGDSGGLYLTTWYSSADTAIFIDKAKRIFYNTGEGINAVNHQNGIDVWIITHDNNSNLFYCLLLKSNGILKCVKQKQIGAVLNDKMAANNIWITPAGNKLGFDGVFIDNQYLYQYNNQTGDISNQLVLNSGLNFGMQFSTNGKYIYTYNLGADVISRQSLEVWNSTAISISKENITTLKTSNTLRWPRLGYNDIILFPRYNKRFFSIVKSSGDSIQNVEFIDTGIELVDSKCTNGNFNTNQSYFYTPAINYKYKQDCNTNEFLFWGVDTFAANAYRWEIKKGNSISKYNTKSLNHQFTDTGIWQVKYVATNGSRTDSVSKDIEIFPILKSGFLGKDIGYCGNALPLAIQGPLGMNCYTWQKPHGIETYVDHIAADTAGMYILETCNPVFCTYVDTLLVYEKAEPDAPQISRIGDSLYVTNPEPGVAYHWFKANVFTNSVGPAYKVTDTAWYKVRGVAPINCIGPFDSINVKTLQNRVSLQHSIVFYPNPAMDDVFLQHVPLEAKILLRDVTGRLVYETVAKQSEMQIALTQLPAGNYQLTIETTDQRAVYNVVKL
jgi:hypothetical protein